MLKNPVMPPLTPIPTCTSTAGTANMGLYFSTLFGAL
jgi:hypothetical protein